MTDPTPQQGQPAPQPPPAPGPGTGPNPVVPAPPGPPTGSIPAVSGPPTGSIPVVSGPPTGSIPVVSGPPTGTFPAVSGPPTRMSPVVSGSPTGTFPAVGPHTGMIPVVPRQRPRGATALALTLSMLGTVLLVVIAGVIWFGTTGGPTGQRGGWNGPVAYPEGLGEVSTHGITFADDTVYFRSTSTQGEVWLTAVDARTGAEKWSLDEGLSASRDYSVTEVEPGRDAVLVTTDRITDDEASYLIDADTGKVHELSASSGAPMYHRVIGGMPVRGGVGGGGIEVLDPAGEKLWDYDEGDASIDSIVAVTSSKDQESWYDTGNPINAERLLIVDYDGTVTQLEPRTGKVLDKSDEAVESGSSVLLAADGILYTKETSDRDSITAYDMNDGFTEIDSWESEEGQSFSSARPCGGKRICVDGYWPGDTSRAGSVVIDRDEGVVWTAEEDISSVYADVSFAGDRMVVTYFPDYVERNETVTQLYDEDYEPVGQALPGWFTTVDDETFAAVSEPEEVGSGIELYDAEVSVLDAEDGSLSVLDSYPAYPGCRIGGAVLACPTKAGYRLWDYD